MVSIPDQVYSIPESAVPETSAILKQVSTPTVPESISPLGVSSNPFSHSKVSSIPDQVSSSPHVSDSPTKTLNFGRIEKVGQLSPEIEDGQTATDNPSSSVSKEPSSSRPPSKVVKTAHTKVLAWINKIGKPKTTVNKPSIVSTFSSDQASTNLADMTENDKIQPMQEKKSNQGQPTSDITPHSPPTSVSQPHPPAPGLSTSPIISPEAKTPTSENPKTPRQIKECSVFQ